MSDGIAPDAIVAEAKRRGLLPPPTENPIVAEARRRGLLPLTAQPALTPSSDLDIADAGIPEAPPQTTPITPRSDTPTREGLELLSHIPDPIGQVGNSIVGAYRQAMDEKSNSTASALDQGLAGGANVALGVLSAPFTAGAEFVPGGRRIMSKVGETIDENVGKPLGWVARGMPEQTKFKPGEQLEMPGEGSQGVQSVRAAANLAAFYAGAKGATRFGKGAMRFIGRAPGEPVFAESPPISANPATARLVADAGRRIPKITEAEAAASAEHPMARKTEPYFAPEVVPVGALPGSAAPTDMVAESKKPNPVAEANAARVARGEITPQEALDDTLAKGRAAPQPVAPTPEPPPAPVAAEPVLRSPEKAPAAAPSPSPQPPRPLHEMTGTELRDYAQALKEHDKGAVREVFGDRAAEYEAAQRTANSTMHAASDPRLKAADAKVAEMEAGLTEAQQRRLFGIGETGPDYEYVRDLGRKVGWVEGAGSPAELADVLHRHLADAGKGDEGALAMFRRAQDVIAREGWDPRAVGEDTLRRAAARYGDVEDAKFMLEPFLKGKPPAPREGPTLGANRIITAKMAKQAESAFDAPDKLYAKTIGKTVGKYVSDPILNRLLSPPERKISQGFENVILEGKAETRGLSKNAQQVVHAYESATKGLDDAQKAEVGKSLSSETSDLSSLSQQQRQAVETLRGVVEDYRGKEVQSGTLSPEAKAEYPQGHLKRVLKPGNVVERLIGRRGGVNVRAYRLAKDMYNVSLDVSEPEARQLAQGLNPRYLKADSAQSTTLKFTNDAVGKAAQAEFLKRVQSKFAQARSKLGADATREIKAGDVQQAKMLTKGAQDVPRMSDLNIKATEPIPDDVAKRIFMQDPATRALVTLTESARRIGKAKTLRDIARLTDEKGPVAVEPKDPAAAARPEGKGQEAPPDGMEYIPHAKGSPLGDLHGKFVRTEVADYVRAKMDPQPAGFINGLSSALMQRFKVARLIWNPRQWMRQIPSNMEFENLAGMSNWNPRYLAHKARGLAAMREASPYYKGLVRDGFLDPAYVSEAELGLAEAEMAGKATDTVGSREAVGRRIGNAIGSVGMSEIAPKTLHAVEARLAKGFAFADSWTKATIKVYAMETLGMTEAEASAYTRKWTPTPESVADWVKSYSRHIVGDPWARYKTEQLRINLEALKERPTRFVMNKFQRNLIRGAALTLGASALSDDETKALRNEQGSGAVALGRNEKGDPLALDYRFLSTIGDLAFDTPSEVGKPGEHVRDRIVEVSGAGDNPMLGVTLEGVFGVDKYGRDVNPEGTTGGAVKHGLTSFFNQFVPGLATNQREKLQAAWDGKPYSPNQPAQTRAQALLDVFLGFKLTPLDAKTALAKIARQAAGKAGDIEGIGKRQSIRGEPVDVEKIKALSKALKEEFEQRKEPLQQIIGKRLTSGAPR